jgi:hypothetical protein
MSDTSSMAPFLSNEALATARQQLGASGALVVAGAPPRGGARRRGGGRVAV